MLLLLLSFSVSVLQSESLLLVCLPAASAGLSHTHAECFLAAPGGYVIITPNQTPEGFNPDYVVTESCKRVNSLSDLLTAGVSIKEEAAVAWWPNEE